MTEFIIKRYLTNGSSQGRRRAGILLSIAGILFNLLLFLLKYTAGTLSGSIAITADGFNNLADSCSCILALLGFQLSDKQPTKQYPMGYGRFEYLSGLLISEAILIIGGRMLLSSVGKIIHPEPVDGCPTVIVILLISILIKGYMYRYNSKIGRMIQSSGMRAAALDSLSDCFATLAILAAVLIERLTGFNADGYTGILVALCILWAGITSVKESIEPLLGKGIDEKTLSRLLTLLRQYPQVRNTDHILLHDYGPDRKLLTFSLDTDDDAAILPLIQKDIREQFNMETIICSLPKKKDSTENKSIHIRPKYSQTKETQECEDIEHQTR